MSFSTDNKHFINIKLRSEMRNLSLEERKEKYSEIQDESRDRLQSSRYKSSNLIVFYQEAFEFLGEFEEEFLIANLILEDKSLVLIPLVQNLLSQYTSVFKTVAISEYMVEYERLKSKVDYGSELEREVLKAIFIKYLPDTSESAFFLDVPGRNDFIRNYVSFLVSGQHQSAQPALYLFFLKLWAYISQVPSNFLVKATIFYRELTQKISIPDNYSKFAEVKTNIDSYLDDAFVTIKNSPIHDLPNNINLPSSLLLVSTAFFDKLQELDTLMSLDISMDYITLLRKSEENPNFNEQILSLIKQKIEDFQLPESSALNEIEKFQASVNSKLVKRALLRAFYCY